MTLEEILNEFDEEFKPILTYLRCWADCYDEPCTCESSVKDQEHHNEKVKAFISEKFKDVEKAMRYFELAQYLQSLKNQQYDIDEQGLDDNPVLFNQIIETEKEMEKLLEEKE